MQTLSTVSNPDLTSSGRKPQIWDNKPTLLSHQRQVQVQVNSSAQLIDDDNLSGQLIEVDNMSRRVIDLNNLSGQLIEFSNWSGQVIDVDNSPG